jgi:hypothetical protein
MPAGQTDFGLRISDFGLKSRSQGVVLLVGSRAGDAAFLAVRGTSNAFKST